MIEIASSIYVETNYSGVNVGAIVTDDGIVCIDAPSLPHEARDWKSRLMSRFEAPIQYLILTDYNADRILTAGFFDARVVATEMTQARLATLGNRILSPILDSVASKHNLNRKELNGLPVPQPQISFCDQAELMIGERTLILTSRPSATPGSLWLQIDGEEILFAGDTVVIGEHPPLAEAESKIWLDLLVLLRRNRFPASVVVPGRGPICGKADTQAVSNYVRLARRRVQTLYRAGRPRADTTSLIPQFLGRFPQDEISLEWRFKQLKAGLDHIYDEIKGADSNRIRP